MHVERAQRSADTRTTESGTGLQETIVGHNDAGGEAGALLVVPPRFFLGDEIRRLAAAIEGENGKRNEDRSDARQTHGREI